MKKILLIAAVTLSSMTAAAQSLVLSTIKGTDLTKYENTTKSVVVNRQMFNGWNTISLPFSMTAEELNNTFGSDCRLEAFVGAESEGTALTLNFQDCKAQGLQANVPYLLYYTGETRTVRIAKNDALIENGTPAVSFVAQGSGERVTFCGAKTHTQADGLYGILVRDNQEAAFTPVGSNTTGFYATRCYIEVSSGTSALINTNHLVAGEATSIQSIAQKAGNARFDVYSVSGTKVASKLSAADLQSLQPGIYVINGKKVVK